MSTTVLLTVLDPNCTDHWMEVHKAGCNDLNKPYRGGPKGEGSWTIMCDSLAHAAADIAGDFIAEGSMTVDQAIDEHIHWAPCVHLPRALPATPNQPSERP